MFALPLFVPAVGLPHVCFLTVAAAVMTGGGGFIPARILRTFLKSHRPNHLPIQAIGLTLYEHDDSCDPLATGMTTVNLLPPELKPNTQRPPIWAPPKIHPT